MKRARIVKSALAALAIVIAVDLVLNSDDPLWNVFGLILGLFSAAAFIVVAIVPPPGRED